jgi:hypothetical protein
MTNDPIAGRAIRAPERCRMLVATEDGVFVWPVLLWSIAAAMVFS